MTPASGDAFERDAIALLFERLDGAAGNALGVAAVVIVGAEFAVGGVAGEHVGAPSGVLVSLRPKAMLTPRTGALVSERVGGPTCEPIGNGAPPVHPGGCPRSLILCPDGIPRRA